MAASLEKQMAELTVAEKEQSLAACSVGGKALLLADLLVVLKAFQLVVAKAAYSAAQRA